jgi:hypothetical protein
MDLQYATPKDTNHHRFCAQWHLKIDQYPKSDGSDYKVSSHIDCIHVDPEGDLTNLEELTEGLSAHTVSMHRPLR